MITKEFYFKLTLDDGSVEISTGKYSKLLDSFKIDSLPSLLHNLVVECLESYTRDNNELRAKVMREENSELKTQCSTIEGIEARPDLDYCHQTSDGTDYYHQKDIPGAH